MTVTLLEYDPTSPTVRADPYPVYAGLRQHNPIHWNERVHGWVVARHADVVAMLRDPRWSSNYSNSDPAYAERHDAARQPWNVLLFMDPPEHTRLRRAAGRGFGPQSIRDLGAYADAVVTQLLDSFRGREEIDLIYEFAAPLSLKVLARLLGVPDEDVPVIARSAHALSGLIDWAPSDEPLDDVRGCVAELAPYLLSLVERKRREPGDELLSVLTRSARERKIRHLDVVATATLVLAAGHVTSTHMIGNGVLALLRDRAAFAACLSGRYTSLQIIDELLRFDAPVQATPRTALAEMELGGRTIRRGDLALALLGSANRDGSVFAEPDSIDFGRRGGPPVSFGVGPHYCIGAELGRTTGSVALKHLLRRHPRLRLPEQELSWRPTITQHGLTALRVGL